MTYGFWSVVPPLVAISLAIITHRVIFSLGIGIYSGGLIQAGGNPISAAGASISWIIGGVSTAMHIKLVLFIFAMGALSGMMYASGAHKKVGDWFRSRITDKRSVEGATFGYGIAMFIDPILNVAFVGSTLRDVSDKLKVSKEKFSYLVDSTAAPVTRLVPFTTWGAYIVGTIGAVGIVKEVEAAPFSIYLSSIPLAFYCFFAMILVGILIVTRKDYGPMLKAENRVEETGKVARDDANPVFESEKIVDTVEEAPKRIKNFALPVIVVIVTAIVSMLYTGGFLTGETAFRNAFLYSDFAGSLIYGAALGIITILILFMSERWFDAEAWEGMFQDGVRLFVTPMIIIAFAWGIVTMNGALGTAPYIVGKLSTLGIAWVLPLAIFLACMFISFATGTSFGTIAIVPPMALPLAHGMGVSLPLALGAILAGSTFGDHCSPISDTTILSSSFSGADHMDHVSTQIPYALTAAAGAGGSFLLIGVGVPYIGSLIAGIVVLVALVYALSLY